MLFHHHNAHQYSELQENDENRILREAWGCFDVALSCLEINGSRHGSNGSPHEDSEVPLNQVLEMAGPGCSSLLFQCWKRYILKLQAWRVF